MKRSILLTLAMALGVATSAVADFNVPENTVYDNSSSPAPKQEWVKIPKTSAFDLKTNSKTAKDLGYRVYIQGNGPDGQGALRDTGTVDPAADDKQLGYLELWAPSLIKSSRNMYLVNDGTGQGFQTWEHALTLDFAVGKSLTLINCCPWDCNGLITVISGGLTFGYRNGVSGEHNHQNRKIVVTGQNSWLKIVNPSWVYIKELEMSDGAKLVGDGNMVLHTGFKPAEATTAWTGKFEVRTDGGTSGSDGDFNLDLSGLTGAWTFPSSYAIHGVTTRTFSVKPGSWAMIGTADNKIISWTTEPGSNVAFKQNSSTTDKNWELSRRSDGLYLKYLGGQPVYATRDVTNNKWKFYDVNWNEMTSTGLSAPTADMTVCFSTLAEYTYLKTATFAKKAIMMRGTWTLTDNTDLQGLDFTLDSDVSVGVKGKHLKMPGKSLGEGAKGGTITSTVAGGVLELDVPQGGNESLKNVTLSGAANLQVWKTGAGRLSIEKEQSGLGVDVGDHAAGIDSRSVVTFVVKGGVLAKGSKNRGKFFGQAYSIIQVEAGARVDVYDRSSWDYNYEIAGTGPDGLGAFAVSSIPKNNWGFMAPGTDGSPLGCMHHITLTADASVDAAADYHWPLSTYNNVNHELRLNNHTLTVGLTSCIYWMNLVPQDAGKIVIGNCEVYGICKEYKQAQAVKTKVDMSNVDVEVRTGLVANKGCFFNPIKSLKFDPAAAWRHSDWPEAGEYFEVVVHDTYRPSMNKMPQITLGADGHTTTTLDLSTLTGAIDGTRLGFYAGSTVTVDVGQREFDSTQKLVSWTTKPTNVDFTLKAKSESYSVEARDDGLYLVDETLPPQPPNYAYYDAAAQKWVWYIVTPTPTGENWTKLADDDPGIPASGVPTADMTVYFNNLAQYNALVSMKGQYEFKELQMRGGTWNLNSDTDLTGLGDFEMGGWVSKINLGYNARLKMTGKSAASATDGWLYPNNSSKAVVELTVPEGETATFDSHGYYIGGEAKDNQNLQMEKTGKGRLQIDNFALGPNVYPSWIVTEGVLAKTGGAMAFGRQNTTVRVNAGAQVDLGDREYWDYDYEIAGNGPDGTGALTASKVFDKESWGLLDSTKHIGCLHNLTLTADASVDATAGKPWPLSFWANDKHYVTFNGHTLTLGMTECVYWVNLRPNDAGKLVIGKSEVYNCWTPWGETVARIDDQFIDMSKVDIEVKTELVANRGCFFNPIKSLKFDPEAAWRHASYWEADSKVSEEFFPVVVHETYRPSLKKMPQITLGAEGHTTPTLDLSTQTGVFDVDTYRLDFYAGSTVTIDVGNRDIALDQKLISWTAKPTNVQFKLTSKYGDYRVQVRDDGLYAVTGIAIILQ